MTEPEIVAIDELAAHRAAGGTGEFWNVLTDDYFTGEMIPGSRRVPLDRIGREATALPKDTDIVVYCSGLDCPQSTAAGRKLADLGFTNVRVFEGGLEKWKAEGRNIELTDEAGASAIELR